MSNSVIVTFIRHGKSTDNGTSIWAGWKDAPLSFQGINQAFSLGKYFADTHFAAIYTSDLKRASETAQALYDYQKDPKPSFTSSELLREQNFGRAEGKRCSLEFNEALTFEQNAAMGVYPAIYGDDDDLAVRARIALAKFVFPHVSQAAKEGETGVHIAIVSHGLCISELISELLDRTTKRSEGSEYSHLENTNWTRVTINIKGAQEGQPIDVDKELPVMVVRVTDVDHHSHYIEMA